MRIPLRPGGVIVDCRELAKIGLAELTRDVAAFDQESGLTPCLALVAGPAAEMEMEARQWLALKARALAPCGIRLRPVFIDPDSPPGSTASAIRDLVGDPGVHSLFLQYPFLQAGEVAATRTLIPAARDVDAANFTPEGWRPGQPTPATAIAAVRLVQELAPLGAITVVTGPSPVGPAVHALLGSLGRDTAVVRGGGGTGLDGGRRVDVGRGELGSASVVVAASGLPGSVDAREIPDGAVVIDAGYDLPGGEGEVRLSEAEPGRWRAFVPPRGGLGPLTVLELGRATLAAARETVPQ